MKWFKHFTNAHNDNALRKVRMKYGAEGYAVYWYCLELIAGDLDGHRANFELSHDAEVIGYDLKIDQLRVEEIMQYMVKLSLFENNNNTITCLKIAKFLDKKSTRNPEILKIIDSMNQECPTTSETCPDLSATIPARLDKNRLDKKENHKGRFTPPTVNEVDQYIRDRSLPVDAERFVDFYESKGWVVGKTKMKDWKAAVRNWARSNKQVTQDNFGDLLL